MKDDFTKTDENIAGNKIFIDTNNVLQNLVNSIGKSLEPIQMISKQIHTAIEPMRIISNIVSDFTDSIKNIIDSMPKIPPEVLKKLILMEDLIKYEWWYLRELPEDILDDLDDMFSSEITKEDVDTRIVRAFSSNGYEILDKMIIRLEYNPQYQIRKSIIDSSVWAYKQGRHELVIPTIIILYEGIMNEFYNENELFKEINDEKKKFTLKNIVGKTIDTLDDVLNLVDSSFLISLKRFFESGKFEHLPDFNRHKILHGRTVNYYTEVNSLKSIVLLVYIMKNIFDISNEESSNNVVI